MPICTMPRKPTTDQSTAPIAGSGQASGAQTIAASRLPATMTVAGSAWPGPGFCIQRKPMSMPAYERPEITARPLPSRGLGALACGASAETKKAPSPAAISATMT